MQTRPEAVVLLCRGCCCGTAAKHPGTDHDRQRAELEAAVPPGVELRVVDCLDACDRSNVAVVRRPREPARSRDTWLGGLLGQRHTDALAGWLREGAAGPLPAAVAGLRFRHVPPRRARR